MNRRDEGEIGRDIKGMTDPEKLALFIQVMGNIVRNSQNEVLGILESGTQVQAQPVVVPEEAKPHEGGSSKRKRNDKGRIGRKKVSSDLTCFKCGVKGHLVKDCLSIEKRCFECHRVGHVKVNCPELAMKKRSQSEDDKRKSSWMRICFNCKERGHLSKDCMKEQNGERRCFHCDETGHAKKDCPELLHDVQTLGVSASDVVPIPSSAPSAEKKKKSIID